MKVNGISASQSLLKAKQGMKKVAEKVKNHIYENRDPYFVLGTGAVSLTGVGLIAAHAPSSPEAGLGDFYNGAYDHAAAFRESAAGITDTGQDATESVFDSVFSSL